MLLTPALRRTSTEMIASISSEPGDKMTNAVFDAIFNYEFEM